MKLFSRSLKNIIYFIAALSVCLPVLAFSAPASYADLIWEPENDYYTSHRSDCLRVDRDFMVNSIDDEGLKVYESPVSEKIMAVVPNGEMFYVEYELTDEAGNRWGVNTYYNGWVPMDYLAVVYDGTEFDNRHSSEFVQEEGEVDVSMLGEGEYVRFYEYPGSQGYSQSEVMGDAPYYGYVYSDPLGHKWGYVGYYYVNRGWVCLDAPAADYDTLYPEGQTFSGIMEESKTDKPAIVVEPATRGINVRLVAGLVIGGIMIVTGVIIGIIIISKKSGKNKDGAGE